VFVNREAELGQLEEWWARPGAALGIVWGRRRVGKTALLEEFAAGKPTVFHTGGGRPVTAELAALGRCCSSSTRCRRWSRPRRSCPACCAPPGTGSVPAAS